MPVYRIVSEATGSDRARKCRVNVQREMLKMEVRRMARILVPIDGSELSLAAVPLADKLAAGLSAELVFVTVGELPETPAHAHDVESDLAGRLARVAGEVSSPVREK